MSDTSDSPTSAWRRQGQLVLKELRETLRDRRTIVTLVSMPVLLYPLLGLGFRFVAAQQLAAESPEYHIVVGTERGATWLRDTLLASEQLPESRSSDDSSMPRIEFFVPDEPGRSVLEQSVAFDEATLGVDVRFTSGADDAQDVRVEIFRRRGSVAGRDAADFVLERLQRWNRATVRAAGFRLPIGEQLVLVEAAETSSAILGLLPLVLLLMTVTGGVYPAIDLTAGERERNTLETLMALPVPRIHLLLAKFVAVLAVTMLTGLANLLAMSVTVYVLQLETQLFGETGLTFLLGAKLLAVLTTFAFFYSATLLMLTSSARSFKEAQAYLIPLLLLSLTPGLVILLPGWWLDYGTAVVPLVNMLLLARELFEGQPPLVPAMAAIASTLLYALAALSAAARIFGNDAVAFGSRGGWSDLFQRPEEASEVPTINLALGTLALLFPLYFTASGLLGRGATAASIGTRLAASAVLTTVLFAVIPLLLSRWQRVRAVGGLRLQRPPFAAWIGALILGIATWPLIFEITVQLQALGWGTLTLEKTEQVEQLLAAWKAIPLPVIVLTMGIVPAVCEELFFRGFLFSGVRGHFGGWGSVWFAAVAFGLFHVVLAGGAAPERFVPSTLMGVLLGLVAWQTNSVLPSILLHATHNSLLLIIARNRDELAGWNLGVVEADHLPTTWTATATVGVAVGLTIVFRATRRANTTP